MKSLPLLTVSVGAMLTMLTCSASEDVPSDTEAGARPSFYASAVVAISSEYSTGSWSAEKSLGEPDVYPEYGDLTGSWGGSSIGQQEFIEALHMGLMQLEFPESIKITGISVYETYHAGAITNIGVWRNRTARYMSVYTGVAQDIQESRIFKPKIVAKKYKSNRIRLDLDCSVANSWCEIDAVMITGRRG